MSKLSYELSNKLKDAGFPQGASNHHGNGTWFNSEGDSCDHETGGDDTYCPTLHELIDSCIENRIHVFVLEFGETDGVWTWFAFFRSTNPAICEGRTPEEAVANLLIAINSK